MKKGEISQRCHYCGGEIDYGSLVSGGTLVGGIPQRPPVQYWSSKKDARVYVACGTCLKCGHIELYLDPKQLKELIEK